MEEELTLQEAQLTEETTLAMVEKERMRCKVALEATKASKRIAGLEAQKRINTEKQTLKESKETKKAMGSFAHIELRYYEESYPRLCSFEYVGFGTCSL